MKVARKFIISGIVQGVGYRFFTQRAAAEHQIVGYVRNLENGDVEVVAEGESQQMENFKKELMTGPRFSIVRNIEEVVLEPSGAYSSFRIER
ncbi:MAG: acylphosphatase [Acidobacteria bacterium]|nr:MAG: acylphosphatase [Acidobacteriota bacterium]GIU82513.1 MAG: acylphosphatase [Pyrinomonadaceae bacterium]